MVIDIVYDDFTQSKTRNLLCHQTDRKYLLLI